MIASDLQFLHGQHTSRCTARVDKIFHGYRSLQYSTKGQVELSYDDTRHLIEAPAFWPAYEGPHIRFHAAPALTKAIATHTSRTSFPAYQSWWEHRYIAFQGPLADRWAAAGLFPSSPQSAPRGLAHQHAFDEMLALTRTISRWSQLRAINMLEAVLLELAEQRTQSQSDESFVTQVTQLLNLTMHQPERDIDYARIASQLNMGLSTLRRRFTQAAGTPMHAWVLNARMSAAMQWLGETDWPIKTIAHKLGYRDIYFFTRQFGQKVGVPPSAYRKSRQH